MNKVQQANYLYLFLLKDYYRRSKFLFQSLLFVFFLWLFLNYNHAPFTINYIVLVRNVFLVILAYITTYHLITVNYDRKIYILLSRVNRIIFFSVLMMASFTIVIGFAMLINIYLIFVSGLGWMEVFNFTSLGIDLLNVLMAVVTAAVFSNFVIDSRIYHILGVIIVGLGTIPHWYQNLSFEIFFHKLSYLMPPLGYNILYLQEQSSTWNTGLYSIIYLLLVFFLGIYVFNKKSLSELI